MLESYFGNFSEAEVFRDGRNFLLNVRVVEIMLESYFGNFIETEIFRDGGNFLLNVRVVEIGDFESAMTLMVASLYLYCAATLAVESCPRLTALEVSF